MCDRHGRGLYFSDHGEVIIKAAFSGEFCITLSPLGLMVFLNDRRGYGESRAGDYLRCCRSASATPRFSLNLKVS